MITDSERGPPAINWRALASPAASQHLSDGGASSLASSPRLALFPADLGGVRSCGVKIAMKQSYHGTSTCYTPFMAILDFSADAFRVPIDYILEARYRGVVQAAVSLPWHPRSFSTRTPSHAQVVHLLNGTEIREHGRYKHVDFMLEGNSGYAARPGYDRYGQVILATGPEIFKEFAKFLSLYQKEAEGEPQEWSMVFRAYDEDVHWFVEPGAFNWSRSADKSRFTYDWSMELLGYKEAIRDIPANLFSPLTDNFLAVADSIREVGNYIALADNLLANARRDLDVLRAPVLAVRVLADGLDGAVDSFREVLAFPIAAISDLTALAISLRTTYDDFVSSPDIVIEGIPAATQRLLTAIGVQIEDTEATARVAAGRSGPSANRNVSRAVQRLVSGEPTPSSVTADNYTNTVAEMTTVRHGEDLRDVALRTLGDADAWETLAVLNGLVSATEYSDGSLLLPGDRIAVPSDADDADASLLNVSEFRDLEVNVETGDLTWETLSPSDSVVQLIRHKVTAVTGDSVWESIGMPNVIGSKINNRLVGYVSAEATASVEADLRVAGVTGLDVTIGDDSLLIDGVVVLRGGVRVPFSGVVGV